MFLSYLNTTGLIGFLLENDIARIAEIHSSEYGNKSRYVTDDLSLFEFALSFFKNSYLSHGTALELHGHAPAGKILVNREQTAKKSTSEPARDRSSFSEPTAQVGLRVQDGGLLHRLLNGNGNAGVIEFREKRP